MSLSMKAQVLKKVFEKTFDEIKEKYGLTMNEILLLLYLQGNHTRNTAKDIVEDVMVTKSHISKSVASLADKNLITKIPAQNNKKVIYLEVNDKAQVIIKELKQKEEDMKQLALRGIPEENIKIVEQTLEKIKENVREIASF